MVYGVREAGIRPQELGNSCTNRWDGDSAGKNSFSDICTQFLPHMFECPKSMDDAVCEGGRYALHFVGEDEPAKEVAVQGLLEVRAKYDFVGAAALRLDVLHGVLELLALEHIGCGCCCSEPPFGHHPLAAVYELQSFPIVYRILSANATDNTGLDSALILSLAAVKCSSSIPVSERK